MGGPIQAAALQWALYHRRWLRAVRLGTESESPPKPARRQSNDRNGNGRIELRGRLQGPVFIDPVGPALAEGEAHARAHWDLTGLRPAAHQESDGIFISLSTKEGVETTWRR